MDVELKMLLYTVALGAVFGLAVLIRRRAFSFWVHMGVLAGLLGASIGALLDPDELMWMSIPTFAAFSVLALLPSLLLMGARRLVMRRRPLPGAVLARTASALLGFPAPVRNEGLFYAALAAADKGDEATCALRLGKLAAMGAIPASSGGAVFARVLPPASMRRWGDVLEILDEDPARGTAVSAIEARAAAEQGEFGRALRALDDLAAHGAGGTVALQQARRSVLALAGRAEFLERAVEQRLPVVAGLRGLVSLSLGRAHEAAGNTHDALLRYRDAVVRTTGRFRKDAEEGIAACVAGGPRITEDLGACGPEVLALEERCAVEPPLVDTAAAPARAIAVLSAVTFIATVASRWGLGTDEYSLLSAGALSTPLIVGHGEWWRLGTTMLLHVGWVHLMMNVLSILIVGLLERRIGAARTVVLYVASGVCASIASVVLNGTLLGVGASGAAMGIFGAFFVLLLRRPDLFAPPERSRWLNIMWLTVLATAGMGWLEHEAMDNAAHGVGFVAGALLAYGVLPRGAARAGAFLRTLAVVLAVGFAGTAMLQIAELPRWRGDHNIEGSGVSVTVRTWVQVDVTDEGLLVRGPPALGPYAQLGVDGVHRVDPELLLRQVQQEWPAVEVGEAFDRGPTERSFRMIEEAELERRRYTVPDGPGGGSATFELLTIRRGGAFALVLTLFPLEDGDRLDPFVEGLVGSLSAAEAGR